MDYLNKAEGFGERQIGQFTEGFSFPATRDDIIAQARRRHMPPDVVSQLEKLPNKKYESISDLVTAAAKSSM